VVQLKSEMPVSEPGGTTAIVSVGSPRASKLSETIAKQIVDDIFEQGLRPGAKLPSEREMLERFGISRGTLREALRILEVHGLLIIRSGPRGGPTVARMTATDFNKACSLHFKAAGITANMESRNVFPPSEHERVHADHIAILQAILAGKAKRAESLMMAHMIDMRDTHLARYPGLADNVLPYLI
jgi:DNA-binding FadR family transcriptional regulator